MSSKQNNVYSLVLSSLFLALALVLPFLTGQLQQFGNALCPMHFPVLLCGFFCGPWYSLAVGVIAPLLRFALFGMPPVMPIGIAMCFELGAYGFLSGFLYQKTGKLYFSLITAMVSGRLVWGLTRVILYGLGKSPFGWAAFLSGAFTNAIAGIVAQLILIPVLVMALKKAFPKRHCV